MPLAPATAVFANAFTTVGYVIFLVLLAGVVVYALVNVLRGGKAEIGSEIELAPNRKPYLADEELEGRKLDNVLGWGLAMLFVFAVGLPLYWIMEPGRQSNAAEEFNDVFVERGAALFDTTENGGFNCAFCHGGMNAEGNTVEYNLTRPDGSVEVVQWRAPALNTVLLRYSREEVEYILTYGRPFSPMPAWGIDGGGPMNEQQIQTLIDYLESIQISPDDAQAAAEGQVRTELGLAEADEIPYGDPRVGEIIFNLGLEDGFAGGAYACGRCHTAQWSFSDSRADLVDPGGGGALGPSLHNEEIQFPTNPNPAEGESPYQEHIDFVTTGSERGVIYGTQGQGSGVMPGFGMRPPEPALFWINKDQAREFPIEDRDGDGDPENSGMFTPEMIEAVVEYERGL
ncbi:MAG: c-type cytochrome [Acidimicrobiales bacterium]